VVPLAVAAPPNRSGFRLATTPTTPPASPLASATISTSATSPTRRRAF